MSANDGSEGVSKCYVFKSRLQEYCQKVGFSTPVYDTIREGPSHEPTFRSTVIVNEVRYESLLGFYNRKAAEQSAAEVALVALANEGEMTQGISQPVHNTGLCKNLLQEYAQKMNYAIPSYEVVKVTLPGQGPHFSCTATIGETKYIGAMARTKKEAEIKAARTALLAIQSSVSSSNSPDKPTTTYTVVPCKKKTADLAPQTPKTAPGLKPKKKRFKKKSWKKKHHPEGERNGAQIEFVSVGTVVQDQIPSSAANQGGNFVSGGAPVLHQAMAGNRHAMHFPEDEMGVPKIEITSPPNSNGSVVKAENGQAIYFPPSEMGVPTNEIISRLNTNGLNSVVMAENGQVMCFSQSETKIEITSAPNTNGSNLRVTAENGQALCFSQSETGVPNNIITSPTNTDGSNAAVMAQNGQAISFPQSEIGISNIKSISPPNTDGVNSVVTEMHSDPGNG